MAEGVRNKTSTTFGAVLQMQTAAMVLKPPLALTKQERMFYDSVVADRETSAWTKQHLILACNQAKTMAQIENINIEIAASGLQVEIKGVMQPNPLIAAKVTLSNSLASQLRALGMSANQSGLTDAGQKGRNLTSAAAKVLVDRVSKNSLLA